MRKFLLLQINDALFPIGSYSHSYGLETYIQKNLVSDQKSALDYVKKYISHNLLYGDLLGAKLAWEICNENKVEIHQALRKLEELDQISTASRIPAELRRASEKIASRFLKTLANLDIEYKMVLFEKYAGVRNEEWKKNYATAYGVFCASIGMELEEAISHFLYAQTSALVTNCVKTIPLSQTAGQQILYQCIQIFDFVIKEVKQKCIYDYAISMPGTDIRSMQHENLYSRLYMS